MGPPEPPSVGGCWVLTPPPLRPKTPSLSPVPSPLPYTPGTGPPPSSPLWLRLGGGRRRPGRLPGRCGARCLTSLPGTWRGAAGPCLRPASPAPCPSGAVFGKLFEWGGRGRAFGFFLGVDFKLSSASHRPTGVREDFIGVEGFMKWWCCRWHFSVSVWNWHRDAGREGQGPGGVPAGEGGG